MTITQAALIALVVLLVTGWWWRRNRSVPRTARVGADEALDTIAAWPPETTRVLTTAEQHAYQLLVRNLPPGYAVLAQVPLARFLRVPTRHSYREWMRRVGRLNADLLVCDSTFAVLAAVYVRAPQGKDSERSAERHKRMDRVLRKAHVRVLNWPQDALPAAEQVSALVFGSGAAAQAADTGAVAALAQPGQPPHEPNAAAEAPTETAPDERDGDPLPSTFFDDLESRPVPLSRSKSRE